MNTVAPRAWESLSGYPSATRNALRSQSRQSTHRPDSAFSHLSTIDISVSRPAALRSPSGRNIRALLAELPSQLLLLAAFQRKVLQHLEWWWPAVRVLAPKPQAPRAVHSAGAAHRSAPKCPARSSTFCFGRAWRLAPASLPILKPACLTLPPHFSHPISRAIRHLGMLPVVPARIALQKSQQLASSHRLARRFHQERAPSPPSRNGVNLLCQILWQQNMCPLGSVRRHVPTSGPSLCAVATHSIVRDILF